MEKTRKTKKISLRNIQRIAYNQLRKDPTTLEELEQFLKDWWSDKYNLPDNHPLLLEKTLEELMIMYYKDVYKDKDSQALKQFEEEEGIKKSDEDWFKKQMGNKDYNESKTLNSSKDENEFEEKFDTLGE